MRSADDRRLELLQRATLVIGEDWARTWLADMRRERRVVGGGWPGTLPEARARAHALLTAELERRRMVPLSAEELTAAARRVYQQAKREWLDAADRFVEPRARRPRAARPDPDRR